MTTDIAGMVERRIRDAEPLLTKIKMRRLNYFNDPRLDPDRLTGETGRPDLDAMATGEGASGMQLDNARRVTQAVVARITENPFRIKVTASDEGQKTAADKLGTILNAGFADIKKRTRQDLQQAAGYAQCRDGIGYMYVCRVPELRPAVDYETVDELPAKGAERFGVYGETEGECAECGGQGRVRNLDAMGTMSACPECGGSGNTVKASGKGKYRETGAAYLERLPREWAKKGFPWTVKVLDSTQVVTVSDEHPSGGLYMAIIMFEVDEEMYEDMVLAGDDPEYATMPTAPGLLNAGTSGSVVQDGPGTETGSRAGRLTVYQVWTRKSFVEFTGHGGRFAGSSYKERKQFDHDYGQVPLSPFYANRQYVNDPVWDAEPYIEGVYRQKQFAEHMLSLAIRTAQNQASPEIYTVQSDPSKMPILPADGTDPNEQMDSAQGGRLAPGTAITQVRSETTPGLTAMLEMMLGLVEQAEPPSGQVEIGASTAPWTARIWQTQANIGPKMLMNNFIDVMQWAVDLIMDWQGAHPEEKMVAFARNADGVPDRARVVVFDPSKDKLDGISWNVTVNPESAAEKVTKTEFYVSLFAGARQLITSEDFYRDGLDKEDARAYDAAVRVDRMMSPIKDQWINTEMTKKLGSEFMMGLNGEMIDGSGRPTSPYDVLKAKGYQFSDPRQPESLPVTTPEAGGQGDMSAMPSLAPAGAPPLAGGQFA